MNLTIPLVKWFFSQQRKWYWSLIKLCWNWKTDHVKISSERLWCEFDTIPLTSIALISWANLYLHHCIWKHSLVHKTTKHLLVHSTLVQVLSGNIPPCGKSTGSELSSGEGKKQEESLPCSDGPRVGFWRWVLPHVFFRNMFSVSTSLLHMCYNTSSSFLLLCLYLGIDSETQSQSIVIHKTDKGK